VLAESDANLVEATPIEPSADPVASGEHFTEIGLPVNRRFPKRFEKPQEKQALLPPCTACNVARRRQRMRTLRTQRRGRKHFFGDSFKTFARTRRILPSAAGRRPGESREPARQTTQ
ncbi:hypothetical protein ACJ7V3_17610, partial [Halomonas elongata]|uniref:hypothetical protein n=1 Tax=Halomonas elongata TaxID=2746 RepID=UPI0038D497FD